MGEHAFRIGKQGAAKGKEPNWMQECGAFGGKGQGGGFQAAVSGGESGFAAGRVRFGRAAGGEEAVTDVEQFGAGSFYSEADKAEAVCIGRRRVQCLGLPGNGGKLLRKSFKKGKEKEDDGDGADQPVSGGKCRHERGGTQCPGSGRMAEEQKPEADAGRAEVLREPLRHLRAEAVDHRGERAATGG